MVNPKLIVVLGMHRSGTSVVTRALQAMGADLGDKLMPAVEGDNPKGFFEDTDIYALNVDMLQALQCDWSSLTPTSSTDVQSLKDRGYLVRAADLLKAKTRGKPVFAFKDPRVAKLLPFWKEVFDFCQFDVTYVITVRHPRSVAKSLQQRNGFDLEKGYLLWLEHVVQILAFAEGNKFAYVNYDRLVDAPQAEVKRLAKLLGLHLDGVALEKFEQDFVDLELRHSNFGLRDLEIDAVCPPLVREIYASMSSTSTTKPGKVGGIGNELTNRWGKEFDRLKPMLSYIDHLWADKETQRTELKRLSTQVADLAEETAARGKWGLDLDQVIAARDEEITRLNRALEEERNTASSRGQAGLAQGGDAQNSSHSALEAELAALRQQFMAGSTQREAASTSERASLVGQIESAQRNVQVAIEEKSALLVESRKREQELLQGFAHREQELNEVIRSLQSTMLEVERRWMAVLADHEQATANERATLLGRIESSQQAAQLVLREKTELLVAAQQKEHGIAEAFAARERELDERIRSLQADVRKASELSLARKADDAKEALAERTLLLVQNEGTRTSLAAALQKNADLLAESRERELQMVKASAASEQALLEKLTKHIAACETDLAQTRSSLDSTTQSLAAAHEHVATYEKEIAEMRSQLDLTARSLGAEHDKVEAMTKLHSAREDALLRQVAELERLNAELAGSSLIERIMRSFRVVTPAIKEEVRAPAQRMLPAPANEIAKVEPQRSLVKPAARSSRPATVAELLNLFDEEFVEAAYIEALGRLPDPAGFAYYVERVRRGVDKLEILAQLRFSPEGKRHRPLLAGLEQAVGDLRGRGGRLSVVRAALGRRQRAASERDNALKNHVARMNIASGREMEVRIRELEAALAKQLQTGHIASAIEKFKRSQIDSWAVAAFLVELENQQFIDYVFHVALGRSPKQHESDHYLHLFRSRASKIHVIDLVFSSEESNVWLGGDTRPREQVSRVEPAFTDVTEKRVERPALPARIRSYDDRIQFTRATNPEVSVVIPVYGNRDYTLMCLRSIADHLPRTPFEVIVVDDKSPDDTLAALGRVEGIVVIRGLARERGARDEAKAAIAAASCAPSL